MQLSNEFGLPPNAEPDPPLTIDTLADQIRAHIKSTIVLPGEPNDFEVKRSLEALDITKKGESVAIIEADDLPGHFLIIEPGDLEEPPLYRGAVNQEFYRELDSVIASQQLQNGRDFENWRKELEEEFQVSEFSMEEAPPMLRSGKFIPTKQLKPTISDMRTIKEMLNGIDPSKLDLDI